MSRDFSSRALVIFTILTINSAQIVDAAPHPVQLSELFPTQTQTKIALVINKVLERYHYRKLTLDHAFAQAVLTAYIKALDPSRAFFLASDISRFENTPRRLEDSLRRGELDPAFDIFRVYRMRIDERVAYALKILDGHFDFNQPESYRFESNDQPWVKDNAEFDEIWRKRIKNDFLTLKLADKSANEIHDRLRKRYEGLARRVHQIDGVDIFQTFINSYTQTLEPHTGYMSPATSENFDISMKLSLEGIGAVLRSDNDYTVVQSTVPGGPARESGAIHAGDQIVGVAQGATGPMEDVVGWRLDDVVDKIRGPKGSIVRLQILSKTINLIGRTREVSLTRNEIKLEDQAAKGYLVEQLNNAPGLKIGVIELPAFYRDFAAEGTGDKNFRSTTRDVKKLIANQVAQGVAGIVIDLRGNGGGALAEATAFTGLFIKTGPVVQVKDTFGKVEVESDDDPEIAYAGPLAILVDHESASASEIVAAAIQDYKRGLIIGEPTFGKGTVQTLVDLNRYVPGEHQDLGRMRLTMAEFFRISGGSTQLRGVEPDIRFPTANFITDQGERAFTNPLPWTRIAPADFKPIQQMMLDPLIHQSAARITRDPGFQMLTERSKWMHDLEAQKNVSLQEKDRREEDKQRTRAFKNDQDRFLRAHGLRPIDENADSPDEELLEAQRKAIARIEIDEASRVLADEVMLERGKQLH